MIVGYGVIFRFLADDCSALERIITSKNIEYKLIKKDELVSLRSLKYAKENTLITKMIEMGNIENLVNIITEIISMIDLSDFEKIKHKDVWISTLSNTDQYGFVLPNNLLEILAKNRFSLVLSSEFV